MGTDKLEIDKVETGRSRVNKAADDARTGKIQPGRHGQVVSRQKRDGIKLPMVEIYETVEGEGTMAGYPTVFVRLFGCNLRCVWCDTKYSYPPAEAPGMMTIAEIIAAVAERHAANICLTGGEPLLYGEHSMQLAIALAELDRIQDIHIETNGAIDLAPFLNGIESPKVRYIMDYKLPDSGESERMSVGNMALLREQDEVKFVIGSEADFDAACEVLQQYPTRALPLFSPVWETMQPAKLVDLLLQSGMTRARLSMQIHKVIWDPAARGV